MLLFTVFFLFWEVPRQFFAAIYSVFFVFEGPKSIFCCYLQHFSLFFCRPKGSSWLAFNLPNCRARGFQLHTLIQCQLVAAQRIFSLGFESICLFEEGDFSSWPPRGIFHQVLNQDLYLKKDRRFFIRFLINTHI